MTQQKGESEGPHVRSFPRLYEPFERIKFRQPKRIVNLGGIAVTVLRPLPALTPIDAARKHRAVLLRLMPKDRHLLSLQIHGAERHHALDLVRLPFLPGAAIKPDFK